MGERGELMSIVGKARVFWEARVLLTAAELDVFEPLVKEAKSAKAIAKKLSADVRGVEALLNAVTALGLLVKKEGKYRVRPGFEEFLAKSSPQSVLPLMMHMAHLWKSWSSLTEIVLRGRKEILGDHRERDEETLNAFIGAMHSIGQHMAGAVIPRLNLSGHKKFLDIGGGSGVYTIAVLKAAPKIKATLFDHPAVTRIARKKVAEEKLLERVSFVKGDFYKDKLPAGHDLALLSAIIHQNSREQNVELYRKACDALVPGGMLIIRDYVMNEEHTEPPEGTLFAINMLVNTEGGGTYSFKEIAEDLQQAGFREPKLLHHAEMDSLVSARKVE